MATLLGFLSWLILSLEAWRATHAIAIPTQTNFRQQSNHQVPGLSWNSNDEASSDPGPLWETRSIRSAEGTQSQLHSLSRSGSPSYTFTRQRSTILPQRYRLVKRVAMDSQSGHVPKKTPSSSKPTPSKPKSSTGQPYNPLQTALDQSKKTPNFSPLKSHVKQQTAIKDSVFNSKRVIDDPLRAPGQSSSAPRASIEQARQNQAVVSRQPLGITPAPLYGTSSSQQSRSRIERKASSRNSNPSPESEQSPQSQPSNPTAQRDSIHRTTTVPPISPGSTTPTSMNKVQKGVSLAWDFAHKNKLAACTVGLAVVGTGCTIAGIPVVAYAGGAKGAGVALGVVGRALGALSEGTGVVAAIQKYQEKEKIGEQELENVWDHITDKSTAPFKKLPSAVSKSTRSISDGVKSAIEGVESSVGDSIRKNLRRIGLEIKDSSNDFRSSPSVDQLTIPEEPLEMAAQWSSPASFPTRDNQKDFKPRKDIQMQTFKKGPRNP